MEFNLLENLILLALDDEKGNLKAESSALTMGLIGAAILQLSHDQKITIQDKNIRLVDGSKTGYVILDILIDKVSNSKKPRTVKNWMEKLQFPMENKWKTIVNDLIKKGVLTRTRKKVLWVIPIERYPTINATHENKLKQRLQDVVLGSTPSDYEIMLLGLIKSCELTKVVFGKEKQKTYNEKIESILKNQDLSNNISHIIKQINEEILAAITIMLVTTGIIAN
ncbi:MAG: GPP34 family phosphoprotein [Salinivirgaceae bacterium]|jgi:Golgi phosphoprotein 3|nr:GPP34 family phosphoprotein [Salinivirgaceae bacterium]